MIILVATEDELRLAKRHLGDYEIVKTGVGAGNVIRTCSELLGREGIREERIVNVGFCGSNSIPVGSVVKISRTWRLMDNVVEFADWRNGYELAEEGVPCYTSNSFVLETDITVPCAFDMELNYMAAFPLPLVGAVKIVSDNLCLDKYEHSIRHSEDETWDEVRAIVGDMDIRDMLQREEMDMKNDDKNMEKEVKVESFTFDHRKVKAPYVRRCCVLDGPNGDKVTKFDLRFCQPNAEALETAALHGLEHLLAENLRRHIDGVIDLSPMGCRTGYYVTAWGEREVREMRDALVAALGDVLAATEIPAANEIQCGNWRDLSLEGAQDAARRVLEAGFSLDPFHRRLS